MATASTYSPNYPGYSIGTTPSQNGTPAASTDFGQGLAGTQALAQTQTQNPSVPASGAGNAGGGLLTGQPSPAGAVSLAPKASAPSTPAGAVTLGNYGALQPEYGRQTVNDLLTQYTGQSNPLVRQAEAQAAQGMNARGLLNSSMALGAGEQAALQTALPQAQQEAATQATTAQSQLQYEQDLAKAAQAQQFGTETLAQQGRQQKELSAQGYQQQQGLNTQTYQQQLGINSQQYGFQAALSSQGASQQQALLSLDGDIKKALQATGFGYDVQLEKLKSDNSILLAKDNSASNLYLMALQQIGSALSTPGTTSDQQQAALMGIIGNLHAGLDFVNSFTQG